MGPVRFTKSAIIFESYDYPGALVHPHGALPFDEIVEVDPQCFPPEVRTRTGETVFVPASEKDALRTAAESRGIPMWDPLESTCRHASLSIL